VPLINLVLFIAVFVSGVVIVYSLWFMSLLPVFWWGRADNIQHLFRPLHQLTRIPIDITGRVLRHLFTFVIPLAFVSTVPAQALAVGVSPWLIVYGILAAVFSLWLSNRAWHFALRHYTSASS
jgi:ABC-2 type transport system permease protein